MKVFLTDLKKPTFIYSIILIAIILLSYLICKRIGFDPEKLFSDLDYGSPIDKIDQGEPSTFDVFIALFKNNIMVTLQILLLALIPIPFVYTLSILVNGIMIGGIFYIYQAIQVAHGEGDALYLIILKDFLPHAVIELLGFVIATAIAYRINQWLIRNIINLFRKQNKRYTRYTFTQLVRYTVVSFVLIILPFIIIAALIEAYITPLI